MTGLEAALLNYVATVLPAIAATFVVVAAAVVGFLALRSRS